MSISDNATDPTLWIDDDAGNIGTVDVVTDAVTVIGSSGVGLTDIAFSPAKDLFGIDGSTLYSINQATGSATAIGALNTSGYMNGLVFGSDGTLYASGGTDLYTVNTKTGSATLVGDIGLGDNYFSAGDLAFNGGQLYESADSSTGVSDLLRVNPDTGAAAVVGEIVGDPNVLGLVTASDGVLYGVDGTEVYSINTTTGAGTLAESYDGSRLGEAFGAASETEAATPCYASGTRLLSQFGEVSVEDLRVGDRVVALLGQGLVPIRWIGHRSLSLLNHPFRERLRPVCIRAGAFGDGLPHRDLRVSPGHALYVDGVLIQAISLVNGITVFQENNAEVTYWHVELDRHDILLAEGLPAESYLDAGNRAGFVNGGAFLELHPDFQPRHRAATCAPLVQEGPEIAAAKTKLLTRARESFGVEMTNDPGLHVLADGIMVPPQDVQDSRYGFHLPAGSRDIWLVSRTWVPRHLLADSKDSRTLGVCVGSLEIDGEIFSLDDVRLAEGWNTSESNASGKWRWTSGAASLPAGTIRFVVELEGFVEYLMDHVETSARAAA